MMQRNRNIIYLDFQKALDEVPHHKFPFIINQLGVASKLQQVA